jgi:hypothetical protein
LEILGSSHGYGYTPTKTNVQKQLQMANGIFMAGTVTALNHETIKTLSSTRISMIQVGTFELKNIMNEIIPMNEWHFCSAGEEFS